MCGATGCDMVQNWWQVDHNNMNPLSPRRERMHQPEVSKRMNTDTIKYGASTEPPSYHLLDTVVDEPTDTCPRIPKAVKLGFPKDGSGKIDYSKTSSSKMMKPIQFQTQFPKSREEVNATDARKLSPPRFPQRRVSGTIFVDNDSLPHCPRSKLTHCTTTATNNGEIIGPPNFSNLNVSVMTSNDDSMVPKRTCNSSVTVSSPKCSHREVSLPVDGDESPVPPCSPPKFPQRKESLKNNEENDVLFAAFNPPKCPNRRESIIIHSENESQLALSITAKEASQVLLPVVDVGSSSPSHFTEKWSQEGRNATVSALPLSSKRPQHLLSMGGLVRSSNELKLNRTEMETEASVTSSIITTVEHAATSSSPSSRSLRKRPQLVLHVSDLVGSISELKSNCTANEKASFGSDSLLGITGTTRSSGNLPKE